MFISNFGCICKLFIVYLYLVQLIFVDKNSLKKKHIKKSVIPQEKYNGSIEANTLMHTHTHTH